MMNLEMYYYYYLKQIFNQTNVVEIVDALIRNQSPINLIIGNNLQFINEFIFKSVKF